MSDWRDETKADLEAARKSLETLVGSISGEPSRRQMREAWVSYVKVEKSIAFIRFEIDEENPGRFIRLKNYSTPDERQAIRFALRHLVKGSESFLLGDFVQALKDLRESRNYLRALLREKSLLQARRARTK